MTTEELVKKFISDEKLSLPNALIYAASGLSKAGGEISRIAMDIKFNKNPYNDERREQMADLIGEMDFYLQVFILGCGFSREEIDQRFVGSYLIKNRLVDEAQQASLLELMKHVKTQRVDKLQYIYTDKRKDNEIQREPM